MIAVGRNIRYGSLIEEVRRQIAGASYLEAIEAIRATLTTLSECLSGVEANDLANLLPEPLAEDVRCEVWRTGERLTKNEFVARVAWRESVSEACALWHIMTVFGALRSGRVFPEDSMARLCSEIPAEIAAIWTYEDTGGMALNAGAGLLETVHMHQPVA